MHKTEEEKSNTDNRVIAKEEDSLKTIMGRMLNIRVKEITTTNIRREIRILEDNTELKAEKTSKYLKRMHQMTY